MDLKSLTAEDGKLKLRIGYTNHNISFKTPRG
jgi:hypothetical protein